jgi:predicted RNase H-like nuclease (RuvC/YqgF family)
MMTCDGQIVGSSHYSEIDLSEYTKVIKASCKRIDELEANNRQLGENQVVMQNELVELKKELDLLKQK